MSDRGWGDFERDISSHEKNNRKREMFQAENVRHAAYGCDWVGTPVPFQRCVLFIILTANKEFRLTAGKFVTVSNKTLINVSFSGICVTLHVAYGDKGIKI
jgi:hypothetical protein